jgi:Domain of unknown function (DUF4440)
MKPTNNQLASSHAALKTKSSFIALALPIVLSLFLPAAGLCAESESPVPGGASEGEKLERQMWADFKGKDWKAVESKIADGFQSVHPDGARDRAGEIKLIENLNLGQFTLSNFKSTTVGDTIVVTYMIAVHETIDQKRLPTKPTPRLSVWKRGPHGWQWICHANLNPIP